MENKERPKFKPETTIREMAQEFVRLNCGEGEFDLYDLHPTPEQKAQIEEKLTDYLCQQEYDDMSGDSDLWFPRLILEPLGLR